MTAFHDRLKHFPDEDVLLAPGRSASVRDLADLAEQLQSGCPLDRSKEKAQPLVALQTPNGPFFLAAILATRALNLGLALLDPGLRATERDRTVHALGISSILQSTDGWAGKWNWQPVASSGRAPVQADFVKLTSGTTGAPRGVLTPELSLVADDEQLSQSMGYRDNEAILGSVPLSHSYGLASVAMPALMRRNRIVLPDPQDPLGGVRAFRDGRIHVAPTVPAVLGGLVQRRRSISTNLRLVVSAGAPLPPATAKAFLEQHGQPVHAFYGASECGGITYDRTGESALTGSLGTPVHGVRVELEDGDTDGAPGRVVVRSPAVAAGYAPNAEDSLRSGVFKTADLGLLDAGELKLAGRVDDIINIKGKKVHPAGVEAILRQAPAVEDAVIIEQRTGSERGLRAVISPAIGSSQDFDRAALLRWCREHLAEHTVPRSVVIVDSLPRTERGKLDRAAVRRLAASKPATPGG